MNEKEPVYEWFCYAINKRVSMEGMTVTGTIGEKFLNYVQSCKEAPLCKEKCVHRKTAQKRDGFQQSTLGLD